MQRATREGIEDIVLLVPAMTCRHCVRAISTQIRDVVGVVVVEADLGSRTVRIRGTARLKALQSAIADAGYDAVEVSRSVVQEGATDVVDEAHLLSPRASRPGGSPESTGGHLS